MDGGASILRPLRDFTQSARQIEAGNLDLNLKPRSRDEIGELAEAFNSMTSRLREFKRIDHDRLMRSQQTTQLAIDSLPDAVFVIGPDDTIEISNNSARSYFGIEPGREVSSLGLNWLPPLYQEVKTHNRAVEPRGYKSAIQLFVDGTERFLLPRAVPMLSPDQRQLGVTLILVDVTQLRQVDEAKSSLVSTVSHELRTPLTSQQLLLGLLLTSAGPKMSASQKRMLEVAKADSDRLYRTIEELLSLSRMESGRVNFQFRNVSPREIVVSAVEPLRQLFVDKNLRLSVTAPNDLPVIKADPMAVHSALTNLLSNALKFTPPGGEVVVSADVADTTVAFSVKDTGPGIPREFRPRIFEKFFRVPVPSGPSGAGLGLSITKNIIEAHHGEIEFACPDSGGAVFRFHIPVAHALARRDRRCLTGALSDSGHIRFWKMYLAGISGRSRHLRGTPLADCHSFPVRRAGGRCVIGVAVVGRYPIVSAGRRGYKPLGCCDAAAEHFSVDKEGVARGGGVAEQFKSNCSGGVVAGNEGHIINDSAKLRAWGLRFGFDPRDCLGNCDWWGRGHGFGIIVAVAVVGDVPIVRADCRWSEVFRTYRTVIEGFGVGEKRRARAAGIVIEVKGNGAGGKVSCHTYPSRS